MKNVLIVGGTDGIGFEVARIYLGRGCRVAITGRDGARADSACGRLKDEFGSEEIFYMVLDVREGGAVPAIFADVDARLGKLDLVVVGVGAFHQTDELELDPADEADALDVNLRGVVRVIAEAVNRLVSNGSGHLVAIGSVSGERGRKGNPAYCAAKAGLHQYMEGVRARLHGTGVCVTTVKPGFVATKMLGEPRPKFGVISAERAARLIVRGIDWHRESFFVPWWWSVVAAVLRLTPRFVFKRFGPA